LFVGFISDKYLSKMEEDLPYNQSLLYLCTDGDEEYANANMLGRNVVMDLIEVQTDYSQAKEFPTKQSYFRQYPVSGQLSQFLPT
jgi:hypothetical protein